MKKIFIIFTLLLFLAMPVMAQEFTVKTFDSYDLKRPCFNNGTNCDSTYTCNITISEPTGDAIVDNKVMTNSLAYRNYSFVPVEQGLHQGIMSCTDGSLSGDDTFTFLSTPSGRDDNSMGSLLILGIALVFSIGALTLGFHLKEPWVVIMGTIVLFILGVFILINGVGNFRDLMLTRGIAFVIIGLATYISVKTGIEVMDAN